MTRGACAHCGLPAAAGDRYCCYGCEIAAEIAAEARHEHARTFNALTVGLLLTMAVMMLSLFLYAEDVYGAGAEAGLMWMRTFYRWASGALATPVMILCGLPVVRRALRRARHLQLSMSALIAAGAFAAYALSIVSLLRGGSRVYFDSAATALVLATLGRYLEATARTRASGIAQRGLDGTLEPVEAEDAEGRPLGRVAPAQLAPGMRVFVAPEQVVPVDLVVEHPVEVDAAVLSGESAPRRVPAGGAVPAGAVPISETLVGRAVTDARSSTLAKLAMLAKSLRDRPSPLLAIADRFARVLTPAVWILSAATFAWWAHRSGVEAGVVNALSVVLVACPCTYAIAAPLVHWLAMRRALAEGVLVRSAEALEELAEVEVVAFDKTGTLTSDALIARESWRAERASAEEIRALVAGLERGTRHPIGRALHTFAGSSTPAVLTGRRFVPGRGVEAEDERGRRLSLGRSPRGEVVLARDGVELAGFALEESIRPEARAAVEGLALAGIRSVMLTGDGAARASRVAFELGIEHRSSLTAEEKVAAIRSLPGRVAMVGDGINDAPALAGATGIAMNAGTGLSRGLARVNLLHDDLTLIPRAIALGRRARTLVVRLLVGSTAYNVLFLGLAVTGALRPVWAGVSMLVSSLVALGTAVAGMGESRRDRDPDHRPRHGPVRQRSLRGDVRSARDRGMPARPRDRRILRRPRDRLRHRRRDLRGARTRDRARPLLGTAPGGGRGRARPEALLTPP